MSLKLPHAWFLGPFSSLIFTHWGIITFKLLLWGFSFFKLVRCISKWDNELYCIWFMWFFTLYPTNGKTNYMGYSTQIKNKKNLLGLSKSLDHTTIWAPPHLWWGWGKPIDLNLKHCWQEPPLYMVKKLVTNNKIKATNSTLIWGETIEWPLLLIVSRVLGHLPYLINKAL